MRFSYDTAADAASIYLKDLITPGESVSGTFCDGGDEAGGGLLVSIDSKGRVLELEILGASKFLPKELLDGDQFLCAARGHHAKNDADALPGKWLGMEYVLDTDTDTAVLHLRPLGDPGELVTSVFCDCGSDGRGSLTQGIGRDGRLLWIEFFPASTFLPPEALVGEQRRCGSPRQHPLPDKRSIGPIPPSRW